jgi:hypothetical protein
MIENTTQLNKSLEKVVALQIEVASVSREAG